jgi:predicted flavoprotein YhiN
MAHYDVIILGAGAAGMMAAIEAGKRGRTVLLVDMSNMPAKRSAFRAAAAAISPI